MTDRSATRINGLEVLLKEAAAHGEAPVDRWNPPYCGDIGLAIRADGTWDYQGSSIRRPALVKLFARVLRRDADGRHYLVTPAEKVDVKVADAPFMAVEMQVEGDGRGQTLVFRTNVDDIVRCGSEHAIRFTVEGTSGGLKPYVLVRGRLEALVTRSLYYELVNMAVPEPRDGPDASGVLGLWSGGTFFPFVPGLPRI